MPQKRTALSLVALVATSFATSFPATRALAQETAADTSPSPVVAPSADDAFLAQWNRRRLDRTALGMQVLTGWAVANIATGVTGWAVSSDEQWSHFHLMNAGWNLVNLGLGASGWWNAATAEPGSFDARSSIEEVTQLESILLLNAGLDVAYVVAGSALWWWGESASRPDRVGLGQSLVVQGGFLLAFDLALWAVERGLRIELLDHFWER